MGGSWSHNIVLFVHCAPFRLLRQYQLPEPKPLAHCHSAAPPPLKTGLFILFASAVPPSTDTFRHLILSPSINDHLPPHIHHNVHLSRNERTLNRYVKHVIRVSRNVSQNCRVNNNNNNNNDNFYGTIARTNRFKGAANTVK